MCSGDFWRGDVYKRQKEIIAYARSRQVTVVPEIDLPGHSYAAMHALSLIHI